LHFRAQLCKTLQILINDLRYVCDMSV
jgi:hypothetical protein